MLHKLIDHSPDLKKLRDEGFEIELKGTHLLVSSVPYFNSNQDICYGTLVTDLTIAGTTVTRPKNHVIHFIGEHPCNKDGTQITSLTHSNNRTSLGGDIIVDRSFSHKPKQGYDNYYDKITTYVNVISAPVRSEDYSISAQTYKLINSENFDSVFNYPDTNSSRAEIGNITDKLKEHKIAIIGLGGTGSYVLDFLSKTPVSSIHLFDGDRFQTHNAFRAPGAPNMIDLVEMPSKVEYFQKIYSRMHKNIVANNIFIDKSNLQKLQGMDFVFMCLDNGFVKKEIIGYLKNQNISFIDVGIGIERTDSNSLIGMIRTTMGIKGRVEHIEEKERISFANRNDEDEYSQNIQIAELNSLNAALAVIKWKKILGFYHEAEREKHSLYSIDDNTIINDDFDS